MRQKVIDGVPFELSEPYAEGHVCNEAEARALNQVRSENIGNNVRARVKELIADGDITGAKALVAETDKLYVFNHATVATRAGKLDPIEREAMSLARDVIKKHLVETGRKIDVPPDGHSIESWAATIDSKINELSAREDVIELAKRQVAARAAVIGASAP